jgi:flagellar hook-associated protein 2
MMSSIAQSLGAGSGIDTRSLVQDLANASRAPKAELFDTRTRAVQAKISAVAQARSDLESFANSLSNLVAGGTIQTQPSTSNTSIVTASVSPGTRLRGFASDIMVNQIAKAQTLSSAAVANDSAPVGEGSLTLSVGGQDFTVSIGSANNSLAGLATAINDTGSGVSASVRVDATGARLVLKGTTGAANAFTIVETGGSSALASFSHPSGAMIVGQSAQDASFTLDGISYMRGTNNVSDVVPGLTFALKKAAPGETVLLSSERPTALIRQTLSDFVSVFNTLKQTISNARTATGGDGGLRSLDLQLNALVDASVTSDPAINSLSDLGIMTNRDGSISLNSLRLDEALRSNPDAVEALFSPTRDATHDVTTDPGIAASLKSLSDRVMGSGGALDGLKQRLERESAALAKNRTLMEARETAYKARLERQFGNMDTRIAGLRATQTYLEQQIKLWSNDRS